jgi:hypothetical protein
MLFAVYNCDRGHAGRWLDEFDHRAPGHDVVGFPVVVLDASLCHLDDFVRHFSFFAGHKSDRCHGDIVVPQ